VTINFDVERLFPFLDILFDSIKKDHPKFDIKIVKIIMLGGELTHLPFEQVYYHYDQLFKYFLLKDILPSFGIVTVMDYEDKRWDDFLENIYSSNILISKNLKFINSFNKDIFYDKGIMITLSRYTYSQRVKRNIKEFEKRTKKYGGNIYLSYVDRYDNESIGDLDNILADLKPTKRYHLVISNIKDFECNKTILLTNERYKKYKALGKKYNCYIGKNHHIHAGFMKDTRIIPENNYLAINEYGEITPCVFFNSILKNYSYYDALKPIPNIATVKSYSEISNSKFFKWFNERILDSFYNPLCPLDEYFKNKNNTPKKVKSDMNIN